MHDMRNVLQHHFIVVHLCKKLGLFVTRSAVFPATMHLGGNAIPPWFSLATDDGFVFMARHPD
jgi:hypothetical protein